MFTSLNIRFHSYGKNEEEEAFALKRENFYGGEGAVDDDFDLVALRRPKRLGKIAVIEAHIDKVALYLALHGVVYFAEGGGAGNFDFSVSDAEADGALEPVVYKKACSLNGIEKVPDLHLHHRIFGGGNGGAEVEKFALEKS